MNSKRQTLVGSFLINVFFVLISTPWTFGNTFFADSLTAWVIYYIVGFILGWYVIWAFIRALQILSNHMKQHLKEGHHDG